MEPSSAHRQAARAHAAPNGAWHGSWPLIAINMAFLTELYHRRPKIRVRCRVRGPQSPTQHAQWGIPAPLIYQIRFIALTQQVAKKTMVITRPMITVFISTSLSTCL